MDEYSLCLCVDVSATCSCVCACARACACTHSVCMRVGEFVRVRGNVFVLVHFVCLFQWACASACMNCNRVGQCLILYWNEIITYSLEHFFLNFDGQYLRWKLLNFLMNNCFSFQEQADYALSQVPNCSKSSLANLSTKRSAIGVDAFQHLKKYSVYFSGCVRRFVPHCVLLFLTRRLYHLYL